MIGNLFRRAWGFAKAPFFSPSGFLARALLISFLYALLHILGFREYTTFISGTPAGQTDTTLATIAGVGYFTLYSLFILAAPVFAIASGVMYVLHGPMRGEPD